MEDTVMADNGPSMEEIGKYVKSNIREWVSPVILEFTKTREIELAERFVRVEEELKSQRELIKQSIELSEKRFEDLHRQMDKRFEQVDKRFEAVDKRFEQIDKRFESVDKRFEDMQQYMNKRFSAHQWFISLGFTLLAVLMSVYQFVR